MLLEFALRSLPRKRENILALAEMCTFMDGYIVGANY